MPLLSLNAKLDRTDQSTSWGFRLHGGKDFGAPLTIQRVTPGSLAAKCGLQVGDAIMKIGDSPTDTMRHKEAQQTIVTCGNSLELTLQRGGSSRPSNDYQQQPSSYGGAPSAPSSAFSPVQQPAGSPYQQNYNPAPKPFPGGGGGQDSVPVALNKQYNTPIQMYSVDNVMDSLATQTGSVNLGQPGSGSTSAPGMTSSVSPVKHVEGVQSSRHDTPTASTTTTTTTTTTNLTPQKKPTLPPNKPTLSSPSQTRRYGSPVGGGSPRPFRKQQDSPPPPVAQSRTFKMLQEMVDSEEEVSGLGTAQAPRRKTSGPTQPVPQPEEDPKYVKAIVNKQYNTPIGLYSGSNVQSTFDTQTSGILANLPRTNNEEIVTQERKKIVIPSKTYKAVQELDLKGDKVDSGLKKPYVPPEMTRIVHGQTSGVGQTPATEEEDGEKSFVVSPTSKLVQREDSGESYEGFSDKPSHAFVSRTFQLLQKSLDGPGSGPPAPSSYGQPRGGGAAPGGGGGGGRWQPKVPTGPRQPKVGKRGDARSMSGGVGRMPVCGGCGVQIRGPFVSAMDKTWCPDHFLCANPNCRVPLIDMGFVEENGQLFCERDYEQYFAPPCGKCGRPIVGEQVTAMKERYHPQCFVCAQCHQPMGAGTFHLENGQMYCDKDWAAMFQTKCHGCQFPIEPGDRWVEALSQNWHSECFNCSTCQVNLEGASFFAKGGRPYCKKHAGGGRF